MKNCHKEFYNKWRLPAWTQKFVQAFCVAYCQLSTWPGEEELICVAGEKKGRVGTEGPAVEEEQGSE